MIFKNPFILPLFVATSSLAIMTGGFSSPSLAVSLSSAHSVLALVTPHSANSHYYTVALSDKQLANGQAFVEKLSHNMISFLNDDALSIDQKKQKFSGVLNRQFDIDTIGRFAMGRYWRTASASQKEEYLKLFNTMIINVYSSRFSNYNGQTIDVVKSRTEGKNDIIVSSLVVQGSEPDIHLDWRLRYKDGQFKVIDLMVEGVSMALTQRSEFSSVIQRGGGKIDILISHLENQSKS